MKTYREWSPTTFDIRGLNLPDQQDWLVCPVLITRDTPEGSIDDSNWHALIKALKAADPEGEDYETHTFNHWGPGWFEIVIVRPGSKAARCAEEIEGALADYPVIDDMDYAEREHEACYEDWGRSYGASRYAADVVGAAFELSDSTIERLRKVDHDGNGRFLEFLNRFDAIETAYEGDAPYWKVYKNHLENSRMGRGDLAAFLWSVRHG